MCQTSTRPHIKHEWIWDWGSRSRFCHSKHERQAKSIRARNCWHKAQAWLETGSKTKLWLSEVFCFILWNLGLSSKKTLFEVQTYAFYLLKHWLCQLPTENIGGRTFNAQNSIRIETIMTFPFVSVAREKLLDWSKIK